MSTIKSTFSHDDEGWTIQGDVQSSGWQKTGGDPKGNLQWVDAASGQDSYWVASSAFTGDLHHYYGGSLGYSIEDSGNDYAGAADVILVGSSESLYASVGQPGTTWTDESITLAPSGDWHVGSLDGPLATKADLKSVLHDVTQLLIRAEYVSGPESGGLDNVVLSSHAPAPAAGQVRHDADFEHHAMLHHVGMAGDHAL